MATARTSYRRFHSYRIELFYWVCRVRPSCPPKSDFVLQLVYTHLRGITFLLTKDLLETRLATEVSILVPNSYLIYIHKCDYKCSTSFEMRVKCSPRNVSSVLQHGLCVTSFVLHSRDSSAYSVSLQSLNSRVY